VRGAWIVCGAALAAILFTSSLLAQDRTAELRTRFDRETDAVRKAKLMPELGERQFAEIREKVRGGQFAEANTTLQQYREEAQACETALGASGIDAEKHPTGYKQLEISLRESLRRLSEMLPGIGTDEQAPFLEARQELIEMDQRLVHELFPRRP
jgi:hypothetical protein